MRNVRLAFFLLIFLLSTGNQIDGKNIVVSPGKSIAEQLVTANTNYIIKCPIDLHGDVIVIPRGSVLSFKQKGVLKNGRIVFQNTNLRDCSRYAFFTNCSFSGQLSQGRYRISKFGVFADGVHDDAPIINQILDCIAGNGSELIFDCDGDYGVSSLEKRQTIRIKSNTTVTFEGKGFLKLLTCSEGGAVVSIFGSNNVTINNVLIDGSGDHAVGGISGQNGIGISESSNITINGGYIRNCRQGRDVIISGQIVYGEGGKGIQIENHDATDIIINDIIIEDCSKAISSHRNLKERGRIDVVFNNIKARNCGQFAIIHQTNGEDKEGNEQLITINNFTAHNCGFEDGLFVFSRTRFLKINGGVITGTNTIPAIFRGRISKSVIKNVTIEQPCKSIIDLNPSKYGPDERKSELNYYELKIKSKYECLLFSDESRVIPYRSLYHSLIKVNSSLYPSEKLYSHESIVSGQVYFDLIFPEGVLYKGGIKTLELDYGADIKKVKSSSDLLRGNQMSEAISNYKRIVTEGYTCWDEQNSRLLIWESQAWKDIYGNMIKYNKD